MHQQHSRQQFVPALTKKLVFHGALAEQFTDELDAYIETPFEAIQLVEANAPGLLVDFLRDGLFIITIDETPVSDDTMHKRLEPGQEINFVPVVCGADPFTIIAVIVLALVAVGLAVMLSQSPETDAAKDAVSFQGATNVVEEGAMLPINYGKVRTGSVVISSEREIDTVSQNIQGVYNFTGFEFLPTLNFVTSQAPTASGTGTLVTRVLHALGEGPIKGLVEGGKGILFNDTKFIAEAGDQNFERVRYEQAFGDDPNNIITLIQDSASERNPAISTDLETSRTIITLSQNIDAVRLLIKTTAFFRQRSSGDKDPLSVTLVIETRPTSGGAWTEVMRPTINGSYTDETFFQYLLTLDNDVQTDVSVKRIGEPFTSGKIFSGLIFENVVEVIRSRVRNDGTAAIGLEYDNESFGGRNPKTEFIIEGKLVNVPSNYNATTRTYSGIWDGGYKLEYTNNAAFCVQDLLLNKRYALGRYLSGRFNKTSLYTLGQFSDVLVDDGNGGSEPRYTLNHTVKTRKKAIAILRDLSSSFRGKAIWDGTQLDFSSDEAARTVKHVATQANVVGGEFVYIGAQGDTQVNSAVVSFADENNNYIKSQQAYRDHDRVRQHGLIEKEYTSYSTSPGQALRYARYIVLNSIGQLVQFEGIDDLAHALPGELIAVYDPVFMGRDQSGRTKAGTLANNIVLDRSYTIEAGKTYQIRVVLPNGTTEERSITNAPGTYTSISVSTPFTDDPQVQSVWGITASDLAPRFFIIQQRTHAGKGVYAFTALEYFQGRFNETETGIKIDNYVPTALPRQDSVLPPRNLTAEKNIYVDATGAHIEINLAWSQPEGAVAYDVQYQVNGGAVDSISTNVTNPYSVLRDATLGTYKFFVRAKTSSGLPSAFAEIEVVVSEADLGNISRVSGLELFNQGNDTEFQNKDAKFSWNFASGFGDNDFGSEAFGAESLGRDPLFKDFEITVLDAVTRDVIRVEPGILASSYTYTSERNLEDGGPRRKFIFRVNQRNTLNQTSIPAELEVSNPQIPQITGASVESTARGAVINYPRPAADWEGTLVYISPTQGFVPGASNIVADVAGTSVGLSLPAGSTRYLRLAGYDTFGQDSLNFSDEIVLVVPNDGSGITTFAQGNIPTANAVGDIWIETDNDNRIYRWSGSAWIDLRDGGIDDALSDASNALAIADSKIRTFFANTEPTNNVSVGDLWVDASDSNILRRFNGSAWINVRDVGVTQALNNSAQAVTAAASAEALADGKIVTYFQSNTPSNSTSNFGDLWINSGFDNVLYRFNGTAWIQVQDDNIVEAVTNAANAQATADGKITTYRQANIPTADGVGDLWIETDNNNTTYRWSGSAWVDVRDLGITSAQAQASIAIANAAGAQVTADGKVTTFVQTTPPSTGVSNVGDLWFDTNLDNTLYRFNGSAWVEYAQDYADWANVSGANAPEDNATEGADWLTNVSNVAYTPGDGVILSLPTLESSSSTSYTYLKGVRMGAIGTITISLEVANGASPSPGQPGGSVQIRQAGATTQTIGVGRTGGAFGTSTVNFTLFTNNPANLLQIFVKSDSGFPTSIRNVEFKSGVYSRGETIVNG